MNMTTENITATLPAAEYINNGKWADNKEQVEFWAVVALKDGKLEQPITARCWMGRSRNASTVYASVWCSNRDGNGRSYSGHGSAGGYGYHKVSAAIGSAIRGAGIQLSRDISGVGESAIRDAFEAIARALGYSEVTIVHG
jgi:hypothetical protein